MYMYVDVLVIPLRYITLNNLTLSKIGLSVTIYRLCHDLSVFYQSIVCLHFRLCTDTHCSCIHVLYMYMTRLQDS